VTMGRFSLQWSVPVTLPMIVRATSSLFSKICYDIYYLRKS
jgi:hypothetical protein